MRLTELVVIGRVGDRRHVEDAVELLAAELPLPIKRRQVRRDEIPAVTGEILEIAGAEIVHYCEPRDRELLLHFEHEIRPDEPSAAGDEEIEGGR